MAKVGIWKAKWETLASDEASGMGLIEKSEVIDLESEFVNGKRKFLKKIEILKNRKDSREKYCEYNIKYS